MEPTVQPIKPLLWISDIEVAREMSRRRRPGSSFPLIDKRDADEWRIRRRICKRYIKSFRHREKRRTEWFRLKEEVTE